MTLKLRLDFPAPQVTSVDENNSVTDCGDQPASGRL
jgi:hypothetical protein